jgi:hypothetical protein
MTVRNPLPDEAEQYLSAIRERDEAALAALFRRYPGVLWGQVTATLSRQDSAWTTDAVQNIQQAREVDPNDDMESGFPS